MDLNQKIIAGLLLAFFLITLLRLFSTPLKLVLKLLVNTALGFRSPVGGECHRRLHRHCPGAESCETR